MAEFNLFGFTWQCNLYWCGGWARFEDGLVSCKNLKRFACLKRMPYLIYQLKKCDSRTYRYYHALKRLFLKLLHVIVLSGFVCRAMNGLNVKNGLEFFWAVQGVLRLTDFVILIGRRSLPSTRNSNVKHLISFKTTFLCLCNC